MGKLALTVSGDLRRGGADSDRHGRRRGYRSRTTGSHPRRQDAADHQAGDVRHARGRRDLIALEVFPPDNPWNQVVADWPLHPNSQNIIASIGADKPLRYNPDMGFILVPPDQKRVDVKIVGLSRRVGPGAVPRAGQHADRRLAGLHATGSQLEAGRWTTCSATGTTGAATGTGSSSIRSTGCCTSSTWRRRRTAAGRRCRRPIFDLKTNQLRPDGWTSADAAGLPIFPAVVRYDELKRGMVEHAMRVTVVKTRRAYVAPATHYASRHTNED